MTLGLLTRPCPGIASQSKRGRSGCVVSCGPAPLLPKTATSPPTSTAPTSRESLNKLFRQPLDLGLADLGTRITLERLYYLSGNLPGILDYHKAESSPVQTASPSLFLVTVDDKPPKTRSQDRAEDYYANVGDAMRALRADIPLLFQRDLNYEIYRDDILFKDPRNTFKGIKNYKLIFWSLRFHGRIFFKQLYVEVTRIWQPPCEQDVIKMRWTVHGIPRVPWEAEGLFDGVSTYKLDNHGRIYEHSVDNILLRDPPKLLTPPFLAGLNLSPVPQQQAVPGCWCKGEEEDSGVSWWSFYWRFSWVRMYLAYLLTMQWCSSQQESSFEPAFEV